MDRLNKAASLKISSLIAQCATELALDIATTFDLDVEEVKEHVVNLTTEYFSKNHDDVKMQLCTWFTKRGEKCNKDRKFGCEFCSVHAEFFHLQNEEITKAKSCPEVVNVTRRGISKTLGSNSIKAH